MDKLNKGTKIKMIMKGNWIKHIYKVNNDGENIEINDISDIIDALDNMKETHTKVKYPPFYTALEGDIPILDDYSDIDVRLTYKYKGHNCTSFKILKIIKYDDNSYQVEAEDENYYFKILQ